MPSDYTIDNVKIDLGVQNYVSMKDRSEFYMHTIYIKQKEFPTGLDLKHQPKEHKKRRLLFMGGWGASSASYFALFKELSNFFEVTTIDQLGFGCSGRPDF